ncbi:hypothetical protein JHK86_010367 [Glycine max]|uniref:Uncharacterized protein n=1 Tax=Glycine max TaxID=3847 RepID=A0A0R0KHX7_SOYBN|nr:hypothetical protein JHK86_010367 [Glycine max]
MIVNFEFIHKDLWDVVENRDYIPNDDQQNEILRSQWTEQQKLRFLLNSKAKNVMFCALSKKKYTKVKRNKLSLFSYKYEIFSMDENEDIQCRTYDNYDHIDKILRCLSRKWRPQVTMLKALKNLESMSLEELVGTLKDHEQELYMTKNKYGEAPPKHLKSTIHLMMNLKKTQIRMSSPSFLAKSTRCGETKMGLKPRHFKSECPNSLSVDTTSEGSKSDQDDEIGHMMSRCRDHPRKGSSNTFTINTKGPKKI